MGSPRSRAITSRNNSIGYRFFNSGINRTLAALVQDRAFRVALEPQVAKQFPSKTLKLFAELGAEPNGLGKVLAQGIEFCQKLYNRGKNPEIGYSIVELDDAGMELAEAIPLGCDRQGKRHNYPHKFAFEKIKYGEIAAMPRGVFARTGSENITRCTCFAKG
jgi:hypothetical protein